MAQWPILMQHFVDDPLHKGTLDCATVVCYFLNKCLVFEPSLGNIKNRGVVLRSDAAETAWAAPLALRVRQRDVT